MYEEQVINGMLHCRSTPKGQWQPLSAERLTAMLLEARRPTPSHPSPVYLPFVWQPLPVYPSPYPAWLWPTEITGSTNTGAIQ